MKRVIATALFVAAIAFAGQAVMATTFAVGTCRPTLKSFTTISAAVSSVPPGSIVEVCPGTYPEQVTISTPLTLIGGTNGNADRATIVVPPNGMIQNGGDETAPTVGAQIVVQNTGPVNIKGITVDGTGAANPNAPFGNLIGIYYEGSFGTVDGVTVRNELFFTSGEGIWAENANGSTLSVTISGSNVYNVDDIGIFAGGAALQAKVEFNEVDAGQYGISSGSTGNVVANNVVTGGVVTLSGIEDFARTSIVANTVIGVGGAGPTGGGITLGLGADGNGAIESNVIWSSGNAAIAFYGASGTIKGNRILAAGVGINFFCFLGTVRGNFINDVGTGIRLVPSSFNLFNNIRNADTIRTGGCP